MSNELTQLINEIVDVVYENSDKEDSKEVLCNEYIDQVLTNDYSCLMNFLWKHHRKYYFKLKKQIKER